MRRLIVAVFSLLVSFGLVGCVGRGVSNGLNVLVAVPDAFSFVHAGDKAVTLNAKVTNDGTLKGVKWLLSAANEGCAPACGTLAPSSSPSFSAVYTPPSSAPANQQATITAVSVADPRQEFAFTFQIIPPASIQITKKFDSILVGSAPVEVDASVMNDPANAGATWTLTANGSTSTCSPACGTLSTTGPGLSTAYTPPSTFPSGANVNPTITATSVTNTAASDSFSFTILNTTTFFKGDYAFLLRGYYAPSGDPSVPTPVPMAVAGRFSADGNGNLTNVEFDFNNSGGISGVTTTPGPYTGTYTVLVGSTGIVEAILSISGYQFTSGVIPGFRCIMSKDGTHGRMIELDAGAFLNSGTIQLQDTSAAATKPAGNFAFGVDSDSPFGGRTIAAGQLALGASGVTGGLIDQSVQAAITPTFVAQPLSPDQQTAPDSLGRGTLNMTALGKTVQYAYYIVDSSHFNLLEIDRGTTFGTVFGGTAIAQGNLTADSVNGTNVIQLTGFDVCCGNNNVIPVVIVGLFTVSNSNSYVLNFDVNDIGQVLTSHSSGGSVSFDPTTVRAAVSAPGTGFNTNFVDAGAWYLYDKGKGFFVEEDISTITPPPPPATSITNRALSGKTLPQLGAPYSLTNISGNMIAGFGASSSPNVPNVILGLNLVSPTGTGTNASVLGSYSAMGDYTSLLGPVSGQGGKVTGFQATAKFGFRDATSLSSGHGLIQIPAPLLGDFNQQPGFVYLSSFYMIAPNQFVAICISNQGFGQVPPHTGIMFFDLW